MPTFQVIRKFPFDAAHRLLNHTGKCQYLHGHRYSVHIHIEASLNTLGMVFDFGLLQTIIGGWIDKNWDHNTILNEEDGRLAAGIEPFCRPGGPFLLPYNPTAENIGKYLLEKVLPTLLGKYGVTVNQVTVEETPNCRAEVYNG